MNENCIGDVFDGNCSVCKNLVTKAHLILVYLRINILDDVQDFVTPNCQISHLVVPKQQNGSQSQ